MGGIVDILYDSNLCPERTRLRFSQRVCLTQDAVYIFVIHHLKPGDKGSILVELVRSQVMSSIHKYSLITKRKL